MFVYSLSNDKSNVDSNNDESNNGNLVKPYIRRKPKTLSNTRKNPVTEQDYSYENGNGKEIITVSAAHFPSDSSKYNTRTHTHYIGNNITFYIIYLFINEYSFIFNIISLLQYYYINKYLYINNLIQTRNNLNK